MKRIYLIVAVVMILSLSLFGCSQQSQPDSAPDQQIEVPETGNNDNQTENPQHTSDSVEITDMAGRSVTVPAQIDKAFSTSATGSIAIYALDPNLLAGWNYDFNDAEKEYILPEYQSLPSFGQGDKVNYEALIGAEPDVLVVFGTVSDAAIEDADGLQTQTGLPVVIVDGSLKNTADMFDFMGELFNRKDDAAKLSAYAAKALNFAGGLENKKTVSVYFGNGEDSLETAPVGSAHAELFEIVGAENVAVAEEASVSRVNISPEQLISWDPDIIIVNGEPKSNYSSKAAGEDILSNPNYAALKAVQGEAVYGIPKYPFAWFDRPPGPNRIIGIMWLSNILYPEQCDFDIKAEVREYYNLYYHMELGDEQLTELIG